VYHRIQGYYFLKVLLTTWSTNAWTYGRWAVRKF